MLGACKYTLERLQFAGFGRGGDERGVVPDAFRATRRKQGHARIS
jgi:hypothetical protein